MPTSPPSVTTLPSPVPSRDDPANFPTRADAFLTALPTFQTDTNSVAANVYANAVEAAASATSAASSQASATASATAAASSASSAAAAAGAALWVSGTTYPIGAVVYSPVSYLIYRRRTAGAGTTDPSADPTNWALASAVAPVKSASLTGTATLASGGVYHVDTTGGSFTATLPPSPAAGDWVLLRDVARNCATANLTLDPNGANVYGAEQNYVMDVSGENVLLIVDATLGWIRG